MSKVGKRATWLTVNTSDRPRDILGLTEAQEATIDAFIGFTGTNQAGEKQEQFILGFNGTSAPTLTDYATTPIGTIILTPKLASTAMYIHQAQSASPVVGDWKVVGATTVT